MFSLIYVIGDSKRRVELREGTTFVGRASSCQVVISDNSVSGKHLEITLQNGALTCRDLGSSNGTTLNGQKVIEASLRHGDKLRIGRVKMRVEDSAAAPAPAPAASVTPPAGLAVLPPLPVQAVAAVPDDGSETPPAGAPAVAPPPLVPAPFAPPAPGVEIYAPVPYTPPAPFGAAPDPAEKRKRLIRLAGAAVGALALIVIAIALLRPEPVKPADKTYGSPEYLADLLQGVEAFGAQPPDYARARAVWEKADQDWKAHNSRARVEAYRLAQMVRPLVEAQKSGEYTRLDWTGLSRALRNILDEGVPMEIEDFLEKRRTWALSEGAELAKYREGQKLFAEDSFQTAAETFATVSETSLYYEPAQAAARQARGRYLDAERAAIFGLADQRRWVEAIAAAQAYLQKKPDDPDLPAKIELWRSEAAVEKTLADVQDLAKSTRPQDLSRAIDTLKGVPETSVYAGNARQLRLEIEGRIPRLIARELYRAGDGKGFRTLAERYADLPADPVYIRLLNQIQRIEEHFAAADRFAEAQQFLEARQEWDAVRLIEEERENAFNQRARDKLREYSLERIGGEWVHASGSLLQAEWTKGNYARARKLLEEARDKCGVDVAEKAAACVRMADSLYRQAQNDLNMGNRYQGLRALEKALELLLPTDESYDKINKFYQRKAGGS